jgi:hypothetical protein
MFNAKYLSPTSFGFSQEDFKVFTTKKYIYGKSMNPGAGPTLTLGHLYDQTW